MASFATLPSEIRLLCFSYTFCTYADVVGPGGVIPQILNVKASNAIIAAEARQYYYEEHKFVLSPVHVQDFISGKMRHLYGPGFPDIPRDTMMSYVSYVIVDFSAAGVISGATMTGTTTKLLLQCPNLKSVQYKFVSESSIRGCEAEKLFTDIAKGSKRLWKTLGDGFSLVLDFKVKVCLSIDATFLEKVIDEQPSYHRIKELSRQRWNNPWQWRTMAGVVPCESHPREERHGFATIGH